MRLWYGMIRSWKIAILWLKINILFFAFGEMKMTESERVEECGSTSILAQMATYIRLKETSWLLDLVYVFFYSTPITSSTVPAAAATVTRHPFVCRENCLVWIFEMCHLILMMASLIFNAFRNNTLVAICWQCHHYYCHAFTNTSFHDVSAIFMECIFKLFNVWCASRIFHAVGLLFIFLVIFSCSKRTLK